MGPAAMSIGMAESLLDECLRDLETLPAGAGPEVPCMRYESVERQCPRVALWQAVFDLCPSCVRLCLCGPCREMVDAALSGGKPMIISCPECWQRHRFVRWEPLW